MEINQIPKPGTKVRIVRKNVIGHEAEEVGIIMDRPFQDGFIRAGGQWSYQRMGERDKICYKITIAIESDRGGHRMTKKEPVRVDKILRLERVNGSK